MSTELSALDDMMSGFVRIHTIHKVSGKRTLVRENKNLILRMGTQILAGVLGGLSNFQIGYLYLGYNNNESFTYPTIDTTYSQPFNSLDPSQFGYLRVPISFAPNYLSDAGFLNNTVIFTTMISTATAFYGQPFITGVSNIYECALVSSPQNTSTSDLVFSRTSFNQLLYDSSYNVSLSWGVKMLVS